MMTQNKLQNHFINLEDRLKTLRNKFIDIHTDPLENPSQYDLDVQSYCLLSHAAFEEFFEDICIYLLDTIDEKFGLPTRDISIGTVCLLHFDCSSISLEDKWDTQRTLNEYIHIKIRERKAILSKYAWDENHGADIKYLKQLLLPVGIDIPHNPKYINSLDQLKDIRGNYAHSFSRVKKPINPEDAKNMVEDIIQLASILKDNAIKMKFFSTK